MLGILPAELHSEAQALGPRWEGKGGLECGLNVCIHNDANEGCDEHSQVFPRAKENDAEVLDGDFVLTTAQSRFRDSLESVNAMFEVCGRSIDWPLQGRAVDHGRGGGWMDSVRKRSCGDLRVRLFPLAGIVSSRGPRY